MSILILSTSSFAGMGPYVTGIINSFSPKDDIFYFLVEDEKKYYSKNIKQELKSRCIITQFNHNKLNRIISFLFPTLLLYKRIKKICADKNITTIHSLSADHMLYNILPKLKSKFKIIYTVHDLTPHESKKSIHKAFVLNIAYKRLFKNANTSHILVTNSLQQYEDMGKVYPSKKIYFHEFPSLITQSIIEGESKPIELEGITDYVLFFGRIEMYKGIDILYEAFIDECRLNKQSKLVIAGSGDIYFPRNSAKEQNVIFINRYIADDEISSLFSNAKCVVFPYISATQSGVLSLSCYFQIPTITSDVGYFKSYIKQGIGICFKNKSIEDLRRKLLQLTRDIKLVEDMKKKQGEYYADNYRFESIRDSLIKIYSN